MRNDSVSLLAGALVWLAAPAAIGWGGENRPNGPTDADEPVVVRIEAVQPATPEYCPPEARCAPGRFLLSRTGTPARTLEVFLRVGGTAEPGADYERLPVSVSIPEGKAFAEVLVVARDDEAVEGDETVVVMLSPWQPLDPGGVPDHSNFEVDPDAASAQVVLTDNEVPGGEPRVVIVAPRDATVYAEGEVIRVEAVAVDPVGFVAQLELLVDGAKVGESTLAWPACVGCEPKPGEPVRHVFGWKDAPAGRHDLVARATRRIVFTPAYEDQPLDPPIVSPPVRVAVGGAATPAKLRIMATRPVAEESSYPYRRLPLTAEFLISRTGDLGAPVNVLIQYEGEAQHGVDCEPLPKELQIPAGQAGVTIEVKAIPDDVIEGPEKLIARLFPAPSPTIPPVEVEIDAVQAEAGVIICDDSRCGQAATIEITSPKSGAQFPGGEAIEILAVAVDPQGTVYRLEFWAGDAQIGVSEIATFSPPEPGEPMQHAFTWKDAPVGVHVLTARATDSAGSPVVSPPVRILVETLPVPTFVERQLPETYTPAQRFAVQLVAAPPADGAVWAVAERPPRGWAVSDLSDDGTWDVARGLVKFGPFTDLTARPLTYHLTPPEDARGPHAFSGEAALDGQVVAIGGARIIEALNETHPADLQPQDFAIGLSEVTAYGAAWKEGAAWPAGPVPIPVSYATRAGLLWRTGERYRYDPSLGAPPECWVPSASDAPPGDRQEDRSEAERHLSGPATPGASVEVVLDVNAPETVEVYALEETVPPGWDFEAADHDAAFDAKQRRLRWGPFYDAQPRRLTYRLKAPADTASLGVFRGLASFDGRDHHILGGQTVIAQDQETAIGLRGVRRDGAGLLLEIRGRPGQVCALEMSADLINWVPHRLVFVPEDAVVQLEDEWAPASSRFFRVRPGSGDGK